MANKPIPMNRLAQYRHVKFLINSEKQSLLAYRFITKKMLKEIKSLLRKEKLAKSEDDDKLKAGWTGEVPQINVDLDELLNPVMVKYLAALKWVLLGDYAGKEAADHAKAVGIKGKIQPGLLSSAYLNSLDACSEHYEDVVNEEPDMVPPDLIKATFDEIAKKSDRFIKQSLEQLKLNVIDAVDRVVKETNINNQLSVMKEAHNILPEVGNASDAVDIASQDLANKMDKSALDEELNNVVKSYERNWELSTTTDLAMASSVGTHQALLEIFGSDDSSVMVALVTMEDERLCKFCDDASKNPDGSFKLYPMTKLRPSGYNFKRKKDAWEVCVGQQHYRCRCQVVYLPPGFEITSSGTIQPKAK